MKTKDIKYYRCPPQIQFAKIICKIFFVLMPFLLILMVIENRPEDYSSYSEYVIAFFMPPLFMMACTFFAGSWPDIGIDDDGILVEFLWVYLRVSWKDLIEIKHIGSRTFGVWLITTNNRLTFFHRFFGLWTTFSWKPGFHLHTQSLQHREALKIIQKQINRIHRT